MRAIAAVALVLSLVAAVGCDGDDDGDAAEAEATTAAPEPVTIELLEENKSGQTGTATLTDKGASGTAVVLEVSPPDRYAGDVQPASLYEVPCADVRESFEERVGMRSHLTEVRNGRWETTSGKALSDLTSGGFSISVHQQKPPYVPVLCGDIPTR